MPNLRSSKKRMRQNTARRAQNRVQRAAVRTAVKKVREAASAAEAATAFVAAERILDRSARKNLVAKNAAARTKRRLRAMIAKKSS